MMVKLHFDATKYKPWQGAEHEGPRAYALRLLLYYENADADDEVVDLNAALSLARFDCEAYDALQKWAWSQDVDSFPSELQAALGRILGRKRPRAGKAATASKHARYRAIADALVHIYGIPRSQSVDGGPIVCAAGILATLPGTPTEGTLRGILSH